MGCDNTPNDILYAESGHFPLVSAIRAREYKFWTKLTKDGVDHPDSPLSVLITRAIDQNVRFIAHYCKLHACYSLPRQAVFGKLYNGKF
jgi:hypothetical protein